MGSNKEFRERLNEAIDKLVTEGKSGTGAPALPSHSTFGFRDPDDDMTLMKYVTNPTGKGSAFVGSRAAIKQGLNLTFIKLLRESRKAFFAQPYIYSNGDILFHVKVPSEQYKINKIAYDVLFLFKYDENKRRQHRQIQLWSNCPSFIFTYCYVYNKHNLIIDTFKSRLPKAALTQAPEVRNPIGSYGYEKSTYIAARYLLDGGCLTDSYMNRFGKTMTPLNENDLLNKLADPEMIVAIYQHAMYMQRKTHRKPLTATERAKRNAQLKKYQKDQKDNTPKGSIFHKSPRSTIKPRQAAKAIKNNKPTKPNKPKKTIKNTNPNKNT